MTNKLPEIGAILHSKRKEKKLTLDALAKLIGSSKGYMHNLENNKNKMSAELLYKISKVLGISMELFFEPLSKEQDHRFTDTKKTIDKVEEAKEELNKILELKDEPFNHKDYIEYVESQLKKLEALAQKLIKALEEKEQEDKCAIC